MMSETVALSFPGKELSFQLAQNQKSTHFYELTSQECLQHSTFQSNNILIRSDNLIALKSMEQWGCSFDIIYIDPPYNTQTKLIYNDNQTQDQWLCMMSTRLILARNILNDDGIFYISVDDREIASLTLLCRELFGAENHIGTLKWRKKRKPSFLSSHFTSVIEYVLIFAKNKNKLEKLKGALCEETTRPVINSSNKIAIRTLHKGLKAFCKPGIYGAGVYKNRTLEFELLNDLIVKNGEVQNDTQVKGKFRVNQTHFNETVFITKQFGLRRHVLESEKTFKHATDDATVNFETNEDGELQLKNLFAGEKVFDFPKPVGLLKNLLKMIGSKKEKIACLDFFAGTATLAQAVMELNRENKDKKYSFCCIQKEEEILIKSKFKTIADIAQARIEILEKEYNIFPKCKIFSPKL